MSVISEDEVGRLDVHDENSTPILTLVRFDIP
jgi:hypothetical protein